MALSKTGSVSVGASTDVVYTVTATNIGPTAATTDVVVSDLLPTGADFVSASDGGLLAGSTVTWPAVASLAVGASVSYTLTLSYQLPGNYTNTATDITTSVDYNPANNSASVTTSVTGVPFAPRGQLYVHENGACAFASGNVFCWGSNVRGQILGLGPGNFSSPVAITPTGITTFATGRADHSCGITSSGTAICWGRGGFGQLGGGVNGGPSNPPTTVVGGHQWARLSVSRLSTCGVTTAGVGYCWGADQGGNIGDPAVVHITNTVAVNSPSPVVGGHSWIAIEAGFIHSCGITTSGDAYGWGRNDSSQLGIGSTDLASRDAMPQPIATSKKFLQLSADGKHNCGLTTEYAVYCWGGNAAGQVGDGTTTTQLNPTAVAGGHIFTRIALGGELTCGKTGNAIRCWGFGTSGRIGNGAFVDQATPTLVNSPFNTP